MPSPVLPEVDYLLSSRVGAAASAALFESFVDGTFHVEWGRHEDLVRAATLNRQYADLALGLVDTAVMAIAERLKADAIATFDRRHFGAVTLRHRVELLPQVT